MSFLIVFIVVFAVATLVSFSFFMWSTMEGDGDEVFFSIIALVISGFLLAFAIRANLDYSDLHKSYEKPKSINCKLQGGQWSQGLCVRGQIFKVN